MCAGRKQRKDASTPEQVEEFERERLTADDLCDAWPVLDTEERLEGLRLLQREEATDFFLELNTRGHCSVLGGMTPRERLTWLGRAGPARDLL